jgi:NAD(P)-dependent dehydrogenase (short-subunit alcohol dehydrogenase family)
VSGLAGTFARVGALDGKVAIVTGAGRGIGRGEALALAAEGAAVVVNDLGASADGSALAERPAAGGVAEVVAAGGRAVADDHDVASWDGAEALVERALDAFGRLDVLVNNAGFLRDRMCFNLDEAAWDDVVRVHLKGHVAPTRFAAAHWRARAKAGDDSPAAIVNTASEAGLYGGTGQVNYVAAKAGIAAMTLGLARELKRYNVRVNAVAPRARTRMTEALLGEHVATGAGDFDEWHPDNVGPVVAWLASDRSAGISGQVFVVVGGRVHRFRGWELVGEVEQDHRWSVDELAARRDDLFGEDRTGPPPIGFGR